MAKKSPLFGSESQSGYKCTCLLNPNNLWNLRQISLPAIPLIPHHQSPRAIQAWSSFYKSLGTWNGSSCSITTEPKLLFQPFLGSPQLQENSRDPGEQFPKNQEFVGFVLLEPLWALEVSLEFLLSGIVPEFSSTKGCEHKSNTGKPFQGFKSPGCFKSFF